MAVTADAPLFSIVIVTVRGGRRLMRCLRSIADQTGHEPGVEVILVLNGRDVEAEVPESLAQALGLRSHRLPRNLGFAGGANAGIAESRGGWVLLLNDDAWLAPGFRGALAKSVAEAPPLRGMLQPRVLECARPDSQGGGRADRGEPDPREARVSTFGVDLRASGDVQDRRRGDADPGTWAAEAIFCPSAAVGVYRRAMLEALRDESGHFLDPGFFMYFEDVDLGWRARLAGYEAWTVPEAVAFHEGQASADVHANGFVRRQCRRNRIRLFLANGSVRLLAGALPRLARDAAGLVVDDGFAGLVESGRSLSRGLGARRRMSLASRQARAQVESAWVTGE